MTFCCMFHGFCSKSRLHPATSNLFICPTLPILHLGCLPYPLLVINYFFCSNTLSPISSPVNYYSTFTATFNIPWFAIVSFNFLIEQLLAVAVNMLYPHGLWLTTILHPVLTYGPQGHIFFFYTPHY